MGNNGRNRRRFYRDTDRGCIAGVCAGVADYFGFNLSAVRCITVVGCIFFPITIFCYIALALLVPKKPSNLYRSKNEEKFWRSVRRSPQATFSDARYKMRDLEAKLRRMERYVTSRRFKLDREFRDLERE